MAILLLCSVVSAAPLGLVTAADWQEVPDANNNYTLYYSNSLKQHSWQGSLDPNGTGPQYEIRGKFDARSIVRRGAGKKVVERYGMCQAFVWVDDVIGPGLIVLPTTGSRVFVAEGDYADPTFTTINTDSSRRPYYEVDGDKTYVYVDHFSGAGVSAFGGTVNLMPSCVGQWRLNDALATTNVLDTSGQGNDGTLVGGDYTTDKSGSSGNPPYLNRAMTLNGTDDYIATDAIQIHDEAQYSISFWFKASGASDASRIYSNGSSASTTPSFLFLWGQNRLKLFIRDDGGAVQESSTTLTTNSVADSVWHHFVYTDNNGSWNSYVDGSFNETGSYTKNAKTLNLTTIGAVAKATPSGFYTGGIDNVMIFNEVLNTAEIAYLRNGGVKPYSVHSGYGTERRTNVFNPIGGGIRNWSLK